MLDLFRRDPAPRAEGGLSLTSPELYALIVDALGQRTTQSGLTVTPAVALRNPAVLRSVSLISFAVGQLPLHLIRMADRTKHRDHPLFKILHRRPNPWQTAFEFRALMQQRALTQGSAYARVIRSRGAVVALVPLASVTPRQLDDWRLEYLVSNRNGSQSVLPQSEIFHVRFGLSADGITGLSLVQQAAEAIALAMQTERAAANLFRRGVMAGLVLEAPGAVTAEAFGRLKASLEEREGAENAYRTLILEEGMKLNAAPTTGRDAQALEQRAHQIEEIGRVFGVPRPLLGMNDTSWGSGIDVLGQMFVLYGLNPWFEAWEQAIARDLLTDAEADMLEAKFNAGGLLRGNMKDQAEFFARGLGSGGHHPWLEIDEVREFMDLPEARNLPPMPGQKEAAQ
ncbi:phage portal protein [Pannonibacter tanglangensis]|uniref:Phage portal protein n=1 Tax=Pannonibacter tanglangensis TaxID=2750084 RepID=A0ABW9ZJD1_9HYPH|nr:phage portal protein [Pannonibacter sp. XCT-34]NBN64153.1 phage portal protein [Pannonibacter sp. XCT-34]